MTERENVQTGADPLDVAEPVWGGEGPEPEWWQDHLREWRELREQLRAPRSFICELRASC